MPTKIEWAEESWNPITGCTPVSEGCEHCYARQWATRLKGRFGYPTNKPFRVIVHYERFSQPSKWKKPRIIFVCSMGDLFHEDVKFEWLQEIFHVIQMKAPQHIYLILTKRPDRMHEILKDTSPLPNMWPGVTIELNKYLWRIEELLKIPAAKHFVSIEPMLGPINLDLAEYQIKYDTMEHRYVDTYTTGNLLDWVICGGESGPGARPMHPNWPRSIRDQCQAADVPFFFKQWGGINKKAAGRLLDGREWNEIPE